jgi:hypothetical protein
MKSILHKLVESFRHPTGLPNDAAEAVILLVSEVLGDTAARTFTGALTDGGSGCVKLTEDPEKLWRKMLKASTSDDE